MQGYIESDVKGSERMITIIRLYHICRKYRIPFKDLPMILEEYISYDNDDNW